MTGVCWVIMLLKELHNQIKTAFHIFKGNTRLLLLKKSYNCSKCFLRGSKIGCYREKTEKEDEHNVTIQISLLPNKLMHYHPYTFTV